MNYEELLLEADNHGISVDENFPFESNVQGLYIDNNIALASTLDTATEKVCILAEELGHHYTSTGNIIDLSSVQNRKQELHARLWGYNKLIGLTGILSAYKAGCKTAYDIADYLDITEEFLNEALSCYRSKYGPFVKIDNYVIYFEPYLGVFELR